MTKLKPSMLLREVKRKMIKEESTRSCLTMHWWSKRLISLTSGVRCHRWIILWVVVCKVGIIRIIRSSNFLVWVKFILVGLRCRELRWRTVWGLLTSQINKTNNKRSAGKSNATSLTEIKYTIQLINSTKSFLTPVQKLLQIFSTPNKYKKEEPAVNNKESPHKKIHIFLHPSKAPLVSLINLKKVTLHNLPPINTA